MSFRVGETDVSCISTYQRFHLLGHSTYINSISWTIVTFRAHNSFPDPVLQRPIDYDQRSGGYTSSQTIPSMEDMPNMSYVFGTKRFPRIPNTPPTPHQWTPKYIPDKWIYTDGFDINDNPRLARCSGSACPCPHYHINRCRRYR
jgi:hypothetical protein